MTDFGTSWERLKVKMRQDLIAKFQVFSNQFKSLKLKFD